MSDAIQRCEELLDAFYCETRVWPPGRSAPLEMGDPYAGIDCAGRMASDYFRCWCKARQQAAEIERLREQRDEYRAKLHGATKLIDRQSDLLTGVVNAIRGEPDELTLWSHADAPELVKGLRATIDARERECNAAELEIDNHQWGETRRMADVDPDKLPYPDAEQRRRAKSGATP